MVDRIIGGKNYGPLNTVRSPAKAEPKKEPGKAAADRVDFSNVLQSATQTQEASSVQTSARAEKLQSLKDQIASGQYRPNLEKVAERMLKFIVEDS